MNNKQTETKELPEPKKIVWITRTGGSIYIGCRNDKPLSTNPDASRDCHWWGMPVVDGLYSNQQYDDLHFYCNFSDVTVESWMPLSPLPSTVEAGQEGIKQEAAAQNYAVDKTHPFNKLFTKLTDAFIAGVEWHKQNL